MKNNYNLINNLRLWDNETQQILNNVYEIGFNVEGKVYYAETERIDCVPFYGCQLFIPTGVKDKKGVMVYSGDVLEVDINDGYDFFKGLAVVEYDAEQAMFVFIGYNSFKCPLYRAKDTCYVVGNCYKDKDIIGKNFKNIENRI